MVMKIFLFCIFLQFQWVFYGVKTTVEDDTGYKRELDRLPLEAYNLEKKIRQRYT